jgi:hypothetical protein
MVSRGRAGSIRHGLKRCGCANGASTLRIAVFVIGLACAAVAALAEENDVGLSFRGVEYFHRWSQGTQHEFTPARQEDLEHWTDMITINHYPDVDGGEKLAGAANAVLGNYKSADGTVLKTSSVPATEEKPAEHFIAVAFTRPGFAEAAFARFKLVDEKGHSFVYSHRLYGGKASDQLNDWLKENGAKIEKALLAWEPPEEALSAR